MMGWWMKIGEAGAAVVRIGRIYDFWCTVDVSFTRNAIDFL
jgi:hypothetical protein